MITIEQAVIENIQLLIQFQQGLALETENLELQGDILNQGMNALFADPTKGVYYVARDGSEIIGCFLITYEWSDWRNGTVWWLQSVFVKDSHRKKGVFKLMYDFLLRKIKDDSQLVGLRLYVDKSNERAMKVYQSMGMDGSHYTIFEWMK